MNTSKLTIATMFVASLALTGVAKAEDPCGAPAEILNSCEVIEEPSCYEICEPDAMLISCMNDGAAECMAACSDAKSIECTAGCAGQCQAACSDGILPGGGQECTVSCGADCMGGCSAACAASDDKTLCYAACGQQCSSHCEVSCKGGGGKLPGAGKEPGGGKLPDDKPDQKPPGGGDYEGGFQCEASCQQACAGSCAAEGARDCEIGCQAKGAASCKAELTKRCKEVCDDGGIMSCDEQYIDIDDVDSCLAELEQNGVELRGPVEALTGDNKTILKPRSASCSVEDQAKLGLAGALFTLLSFGFGATFLRRRRR